MRKITVPVKPKSRPPATFPELEPVNELLKNPPTCTKERLMHIRALGKRIDSYIRYMCAVDRLSGSSSEVKDKALAYFYERLFAMEQELSKIQDRLQLE